MRILNADEQEAMDKLTDACRAIYTLDTYLASEPRTNVAEFNAAVHVLQAFIVQHALHRLDPDHWGDW